MTVTQIIFLVVGILAGVFLAWFFVRRQGGNRSDDNSFLLLQNQLNEMARLIDERLGKSHEQIHDSVRHQFSESQKLVGKFIEELRTMTDKVARVEETGKQMVGFASELQDLGDLLKNPKQRGVLGEYYLETLLKNTLPPGSYEMQFGFKDGTIVDAAVFVKDKIIPVDSKFSLENYNRLVEARDKSEHDCLEKLFVADLKSRIVETSKYIKPDQGTTNFAFMFIPHEAIYYDLLTNKVGALTDAENANLVQRAAGKYKVIIVSPTSFLAYLQTVLQGLKALEIEERAQEIIKHVENLGKHIESYEGFMRKLGISLGTTVSHYNTAHKELKKIDKDVLRIAGTSAEFTPIELDKPTAESE